MAEDYAGAEPPTPLALPQANGRRRNIGCGWWPIGSDADRDCAARVGGSDDCKRDCELDGRCPQRALNLTPAGP